MGKRLIIAEKPPVGRDIAKVLNCRENGNGCLIGGNDIVTWAVGHLVGLCYPDERYTEWRIEDLSIFPEPFQLKVLESSEKQFDIIKALMNKCFQVCTKIEPPIFDKTTGGPFLKALFAISSL